MKFYLTNIKIGFRLPTMTTVARPTPLHGQQLGLALKDEALARFEGDPWLAMAREAARQMLLASPAIPLTIDDVLEMVGPPPRQNIAGAVFHIKGFRRVGYTTSKKPHAHGNLIGMWVLA